jgi:2-keto-4-pentenoate hydratase/2-oxohepta-3-ene-1,7-dioic acid hydratase in catechol pathway
MKIGRMATAAGPHVCSVDDERVVDLALAAHEQGLDWLAPLFRDLRLFLASGEAGRDAARRLQRGARDRALPLASVRLLPPVEQGSRILAHVVNYQDHGGNKLVPPEQPFFFTKLPGTPVAHGDPIAGHAFGDKLDYEAELAVIIGRAGRDIAAENAYAYVGGYTVCNDVSWRGLQANHDAPSLTARYGQNWIQGKSLDGSCPLGPAIVLSDELPQPYPLRITCRVNGEVRQDASTSQMIFKVPELIAAISRSLTLQPGDVIATGSPAGCAVADGRYLRSGDLVECEIERIGLLSNRVLLETTD